jgi:predicted O-methyltransferase YrrM
VGWRSDEGLQEGDHGVTRIPDYPSGDWQQWAAVDDYFAAQLTKSDEPLQATLRENAAAGLPAHDVSPLQGQMLGLFARMAGAKRILEIGTLGGYSTIWLARALPPGGGIVTIERDAGHAETARRNIARAGFADTVDIHVGPALDILPRLDGPFDLIFIDADKPNNPHYLRWALRLSRPGTVIVGDNVVRGGGVVDGASSDPNVKGVRSFVEILGGEPAIEATAIQTVGEKGWDGFILALVGAGVSANSQITPEEASNVSHRPLRFRRELDDLTYSYQPAGVVHGRPAWRRIDLDLSLQWTDRVGWHVADDAGTILSRPWDVEKEDQGSAPPAGIWISCKGRKSYVYALEWLDSI